ncbi:universal stress protein [Aequorivita viscosa]|uniref:Nucleotide-binding universal stress protein, UspA family n=1 Tax=Aequorivita viscosa TaxID=797419 RepID=A0A1M6N5F1_9FLAO|nr:universal stress protein [Aequorivita viscosa]SDX42015.1 Nucleotide-binding universal stress protein, UspA family [Aequorivita viscosa]SHJ90901.1 Nucleotide-binding universal stress protein, UspA family [Aequorivita viscosa]
MKTIIVPIDFSEHSEYALHTAAILAKEQNAEIIALHMLELSTVHAYGEESQSKHIEKALYYTKLAEKKFDGFLNKEYLKGISVTPIIRHFKVFSELGEVVAENNADLVVMGSKGSSGLTEFFIGSNTEKVVRNSEVPVLVVKNKPIDWNVKKVVFATDFSEEAIPSFSKSIALLDAMKADVQMLYVNVPGEGFKATDEMEWAVETFLEQAEGNLDRVKDVHFIADKSAEKGILKYAKKVDADIVAVTTHGRTGLARFFEGSVSEDLVNHADFAILSFRID